MQIIYHKNPNLSICQKFFIEKSIELLHYGSIDSYRVRLNNPKTILEELKYCLQEFKRGRIKHFSTIKAKDKNSKSLTDEVLMFLIQEPNYLEFNSISKVYLNSLISNITDQNYKKLIPSIDILLNENVDYLNATILGLKELIDNNDVSLDSLEKIDITLNILFSELISIGYSKGYLYKLVYALFVYTLRHVNNFNDKFDDFITKITNGESDYSVVFRLDTTYKVYGAISNIMYSSIELYSDIDNIELHDDRSERELLKFKTANLKRKFVKCRVLACDHLSALKKATNVFSEYLDIINLGLTDEFLHIHNRSLVIDERFPEKGRFQNNINVLDGKYKAEIEHYIQFSQKMPNIISNPNVANETKEKIKSAIRYLRLGNQSSEVEHKFINYWIGLEYLFSNYESQNTINRIKDHFINAHCLAYLNRNLNNFKISFMQLCGSDIEQIESFNAANDDFLENKAFYNEVGAKLSTDFPLLGYRARKLEKWLFSDSKRGALKYIERHKENLEIHFTRIYRLRNEIIHDAATNMANEQIASHLRYYLTYILNELIDFFSRGNTIELSIEDYFILNEIKLGNIENQNYPVNDLININCSIDFIS